MAIILILHLLEHELPGAESCARVLLYADPGSGALALQLLLASFFGALFYLRSYLFRLKRMLTRKARRGVACEMSESTTPNDAAALADTTRSMRER